jgi:hypothetical protein
VHALSIAFFDILRNSMAVVMSDYSRHRTDVTKLMARQKERCTEAAFTLLFNPLGIKDIKKKL